MKKWIFGLVVVISLMGVSCSSVNGVKQPSPDTFSHPPPSMDKWPLQVKGVPVEDDYLPGQTVEIKL